MVVNAARWSCSSGDRINLRHSGCGFDCIFLQTVLLERNVNLPKFRHFNTNEILCSEFSSRVIRKDMRPSETEPSSQVVVATETRLTKRRHAAALG